MTLSLPMSKADFTSDKQALFKKSIAAAAGAGVSEADVTINKIETIPIGRRLLAESIRVGTTIKASNLAAAETIAQDLTADKLNAELSKNSLPRATVLEVPKVSAVSDATSSLMLFKLPWSLPKLMAVMVKLMRAVSKKR